jgi:hypothetical protein
MADPQIPISNPNYLSSVSFNRSQYEQGIYLELLGDTRFPPLSVVQVTDNAWPDNTQAYIPSDVKLGTQPLSGSFWTPNNPPPSLTATVIYPKFATLNYIVNSEDFIIGQGGFTTITAGQSAFGTFGALQILGTNATFNGLTATGSFVGAITGVSIASTVGIIYGPFTGVACSAGGPVIVYNA